MEESNKGKKGKMSVKSMINSRRRRKEKEMATEDEEDQAIL